MLVKVNSGAVLGVEAYQVEVEVDLSMGLQVFHIVGLPDGAVREARLRVPAAIENAGYEFPDDKITVNLAPADTRKDGTAFDLPIAVGVLKAVGYIERKKGVPRVEDFLVAGELSLDGQVRPVRGVLPMAVLARETGLRGVVVPNENAQEAALCTGLEVVGVSNLSEVISFFNGKLELEPTLAEMVEAPKWAVDFADVVEQKKAKRALEIAAAGGHNVLMIGPPGSGKSMLARRVPTILPDLSFEEALETTKVFSVVGGLRNALIQERPFRAPHHTISEVGLIGGGSGVPRPGEVSLAHHGVLFLDELPEFRRAALEVLRQPLEDGSVTIRRSQCSVTYPANLMLVAAMNPCPCGYAGANQIRRCSCSPDRIHAYRARISGPLLDRIDLHVEVASVPVKALTGSRDEEASKAVRTRVIAARHRQQARFSGEAEIYCNAQMSAAMVEDTCVLSESSRELLGLALTRHGMSARAYGRILKVARTIADLAGAEMIEKEHIGEAVGYRVLDRSR